MIMMVAVAEAVVPVALLHMDLLLQTISGVVLLVVLVFRLLLLDLLQPHLLLSVLKTQQITNINTSLVVAVVVDMMELQLV